MGFCKVREEFLVFIKDVGCILEESVDWKLLRNVMNLDVCCIYTRIKYVHNSLLLSSHISKRTSVC